MGRELVSNWLVYSCTSVDTKGGKCGCFVCNLVCAGDESMADELYKNDCFLLLFPIFIPCEIEKGKPFFGGVLFFNRILVCIPCWLRI